MSVLYHTNSTCLVIFAEKYNKTSKLSQVKEGKEEVMMGSYDGEL